MIECKECGQSHENDNSINGYCDKCIDKFQRQEEQKHPWRGRPSILIPNLVTIGPIDPKWARVFNG